MKRTLLTILTFTGTLSLFAQYQGFENWTSDSIPLLDEYQTGAMESYANFGTTTTYPSNDAQLGSTSIKLETNVNQNGDTVFGYFLSGDPDNGRPGQAIVGLSDVDSVIGYYKSNLLPNDSAVLLCQTTLNGATTGGGIFYFKGVQSAWTRFAFPALALSCDSMLFAIASGDPLNNFKGIPGSWIMVDNIQLKASNGTMAPIANHSFENWSTYSWEQPNDWNTSNIWALGESLLPAIKSGDFYSGSYAIELTTIQSTQHGDTIAGIATNGNINFGNMNGGQAIQVAPTLVEFYYKYAPVGIDTAFVVFQFSLNGTPIEIAGSGLLATSNYTYFSQPLNSMTVDTVLIMMFSGENPGSKLKVDAIDLTFPVGVSDLLKVEKIVSYPNPATDKLNIKFSITENSDVSIRLVDIQGRELTKRSLGHLNSGEYLQLFDTQDFNSGSYFIEFTLGDKKVINKFIIQ